MRNADLTEADLTETSLITTALSGALLKRASVVGVVACDGDLSQTELVGADLTSGAD